MSLLATSFFWGGWVVVIKCHPLWKWHKSRFRMTLNVIHLMRARWAQCSSRLRRGLILEFEGQIGFSALWQMAVLTLETSRGGVLLSEIKELTVERSLLSVSAHKQGQSHYSVQLLVVTAVMWALCLHVVQISVCLCVCSSEKSSSLNLRTFIEIMSFSSQSGNNCSHDSVTWVEGSHFSTMASSAARTKGGFASFVVRDRLLFTRPHKTGKTKPPRPLLDIPFTSEEFYPFTIWLQSFS